MSVTAGKNRVIDIVMEENAIMGAEVVVLGEMLKGQAKALNQQKTSSKISNIISADQVGRFPDANIGDALKRVPGITMQNDQGEARDIIIRGLAPELNSVTLNGNRIPSAEGDNRNVQMDLIPADMISTVEVSKTLTSDMDADAIGGSVDLVTRATPNRQRISATLSGGYNPIRDKYTYSGAFIYGNRFFNNQLGVVVSASYEDKNYGSDDIEAIWSRDKKGNVYLSQSDVRRYEIERVRRSFSGAVDYKINDNHTIAADWMYNWRDDRENRFRTRYRSMKPIYDENDNITAYTGDIRRETKGGIDNNRNKKGRLEDQRVQSYALGGEHLLTERFDLDWNISYSKASEDRPNERYIDFQQKGVSIQQELSDGYYPFIRTLDEEVSAFKLRKITENHNYTEEEELAFKINARIPLSVVPDQKGRLRFGARGRFKDKKRDNIFYAYEPLNTIGTLADVENVYWDGKGYQAGSKYIPGTFATPSYMGNLDLKNTSLFEEELQPLEYLSKNYTAKEQILAGYLRWDQNLSTKALLILGVRAENTHIEYTGNRVFDHNDQVSSEQVSETNSYINILPNVNFKYEVDRDFILRAAFTTALARPNYYNLVPYTNISTSDGTISLGNPDLKATYAYNFDLMAEKYFTSVGLLSGGVFYKNLQNFIYTYKSAEYTGAEFTRDFPAVTNPIQAGESWEFTQARNGKEVNILGLEIAMQRKLDFLPGYFLKNLAVYMNYTFTHSNAKGISDSEGNERTDISLPGTAPHMFNGSLSWENNKLSARASLNYASGYINTLGADEFSDGYYDKQLFLDVNASYKFTPFLRLFAEANNLTNQPLRYYQGQKDRVMKLEYYRPTFTVGVKFDF